MKRLNFNDVIKNSGTSKTCVSIYLPCNPNLGNFQDPDNQFKMAIRKIRSLRGNLSEPEVSAIITKLVKDYHIISKERLNHGVAWFYSDLFYGYMPISWKSDPFVVVADSFHIKPILRDRQINKPFFLLLVGAKSIRLFSNSSGFLKLIEVDNLQLTGPAISSMNQRKIVASSGKLISRHCSSSSEPLILAGSKVLTPNISEELGYPFQISPIISCGADSISLEELNEKALTISIDYYKSLEDQIVKDFRYCKTSKKIISDIEKISVAAISGQVENLVVAEDYNIWGVVNKKSGSVKLHNEQKNSTDDDVLDDISEIVYRCKGNVWVIPRYKLNGSHIYATLRW